MANHLGQDIWYLLNMFDGLGYVILFFLLIIWLRLILQVIEDAVSPRQKKPNHRFVHPLGSFRPTTMQDGAKDESQRGSSSRFFPRGSARISVHECD